MRYLFPLHISRKVCLLVFLVCSLIFVAPFVYGLELESLNFKILDPLLHDTSGDEMTSSNFRLRGLIGQLVIGDSDANNFSVLSGFLYFRDAVTVTPPPPPPSVAVTGTDNGSVLRPDAPSPSAYPSLTVPCERIGDLNCDGNVDLQDLSIFLFHTKDAKQSPVDFNKDMRTDNGYEQDTGFYQAPKLSEASEDEFVGASKSIEDKISMVKQKAIEATSYGISVGKEMIYGFRNFLKIVVLFIYDLARTIFSNLVLW